MCACLFVRACGYLGPTCIGRTVPVIRALAMNRLAVRAGRTLIWLCSYHWVWSVDVEKYKSVPGQFVTFDLCEWHKTRVVASRCASVLPAHSEEFPDQLESSDPQRFTYTQCWDTHAGTQLNDKSNSWSHDSSHTYQWSLCSLDRYFDF